MPDDPRAIIVIGSSSDAQFAEGIRQHLQDLSVAAEMRVASAHKSARHLLDMLAVYEAEGGPRVYIAVAGRSNALAGLIDANVAAPVIACPPYSERFGGADIFSSLRMPSGIGPMVVLEPENAALAAAKILGLVQPSLQDSVRALQREHQLRIVADDQRMQEST